MDLKEVYEVFPVMGAVGSCLSMTMCGTEGPT